MVNEFEDEIDINDIPQSQTDNFPIGVSEHIYDTLSEMEAFIEGVTLAQDIDVEVSDKFRRNGQWVVRVRVGDF